MSVPPKPWDKGGVTVADGSPFASSSGPAVTADENKPWGGRTGTTTNAVAGPSGSIVGRTQPTRPWENATGAYATSAYGTSAYGRGGAYGGYGSTSYGAGGYGSSFGAGGYGMSSSYNGMGSRFGTGGMGYGQYGGLGGYGSGGAMYGSQMGGQMGLGYGRGGMSMGDSNDPNGIPPPQQPPGAWMVLLHSLAKIAGVFGRISELVAANVDALNFVMNGLLTLFERGGLLYSELMHFIFRILGGRLFRKRGRPLPQPRIGPPQIEGPNSKPLLEGPNPIPLLDGPKSVSPPQKAALPPWDELWPDKGQ